MRFEGVWKRRHRYVCEQSENEGGLFFFFIFLSSVWHEKKRSNRDTGFWIRVGVHTQWHACIWNRNLEVYIKIRIKVVFLFFFLFLFQTDDVEKSSKFPQHSPNPTQPNPRARHDRQSRRYREPREGCAKGRYVRLKSLFCPT
ncbi:hypothetical protein K440DRAFT_30885 [Wilcoxina mikolae CBS 423.85]|nr:hypothetical protein K440DRAFT_30885 [Wilcoxina mikolae CBS 423.85]